MPRRRNFAVHWTETASLDLDSITDYLAHDDIDRAERVLREIKETVLGLTLFPKRGRIVAELKEHGLLLYRELLHSPWRIIYRIEGSAVFILAILDGRRNLEDLLLERFLH